MRFATILLAISVAVAFVAPQRAIADFTFGEPVKVGSIVHSSDDIDCLSYDGLEMYISSMRAGTQGGWDLWVLKRASTDEDWGPPQNLGPAVNSPQDDLFSSISADGLTLYFESWRGGDSNTGYDIYMTTRATKDGLWGQAVNLGPTVNRSGTTDCEPWISPDGLELYFGSYRGGYGACDIWVTRRATTTDPWGQPLNVGPVVNSAYEEHYLSLSPDGLLLLFSDCHDCSGQPPRPGGYGGDDMWMARRASIDAPWQAAVNLGPIVNGPKDEDEPRISHDGRTLYFWGTRVTGAYDVWQASIDPIVDLNGDGKVDDDDIQMIREHWGQNYPRCDIGPFPWGDGVVDSEDLKVLVKNAVNPVPYALEVPRDVILSWKSPEFAETHDVYFGTSFEDVNIADRADPKGMLVSQGQTATAYDPEGLLEFGRTYYWRIDEVGGAPDFTIYRGPVLNFTTESFAYPITKVTATASISQANWGPGKTIDGSGLDKNDGHSTTSTDMWLSTTNGSQPVWIKYTFDRVYALYEMWVWNHNLSAEAMMGFGFKDVIVQYSANGMDWTTLTDMEFARAAGQDGYTHNTTVSFGDVPAKYVKLTAKSNWSGAASPCGLSEVRFFCIPAYASQPTPASGRQGVNLDAILTWKAGREAASHQVYLSTDRQAVANGTALVTTVSETTFDPGPLDLGQTYYWRINEVGEAQTPSVWEGELWSFSTKEYFVVDDFEDYTDDVGQRIFQTWIDGAGYTEPAPGNTGNSTSSRVGNVQVPFAERAIVHGGTQSMPLGYNNADVPFYSEAERTWTESQDWTVNGADTLILWLRGNPTDFLLRADGSIQMSGGGTDIWDTSDEFRVAYKQLRGDGSIVARIHSMTNTNSWAKAGVMIRESLDPASSYAFMFPTPEGRRAFQNRTITGGHAGSAHSNAGVVTLPIWLKVERKGDQFTGYYSPDGKNWTVNPPDVTSPASDFTNPVSILMTEDVYIGLAVTSHNISMPANAEFSDVSFSGTVTGQWQVAAIGAEQPTNDPAPLYLALEDNAGHVGVVTHADLEAVQTATWQAWTIPLSDFNGVDPSGIRKMSIGVGDRASPTAGGSGVIYIDDIAFGHPLSPE